MFHFGLVGGYGALGVRHLFVLSYYLIEQPMLRLRGSFARQRLRLFLRTNPLHCRYLATESRELKSRLTFAGQL